MGSKSALSLYFDARTAVGLHGDTCTCGNGSRYRWYSDSFTDIATAGLQCPSSLDKFSSSSHESSRTGSCRHPHCRKRHSLTPPLPSTSAYRLVSSSCTVNACLRAGRVKSALSALNCNFFLLWDKSRGQMEWVPPSRPQGLRDGRH